MLKWLIGPVLLGTGCIAGSVYGRDAEQLVHKSPADTYAAVEQAVDNVPASGTTYFDGGKPMPYEVRTERTPGQRIVVTLLFAGQQGAEADLDFTPADGGKATLITAHVKGDHSVLRSALAGTGKARLAYAPDWMLNIAARSLLKQVADEIEQGQIAEIVPPMTEADAESQWEQNLSDEQRNDVQDWRQYDATRPTTDPDEDAANYMHNGEQP
jgi:hypothetical protein